MKNISIEFDDEKLKALRFFCMQKENTTLEKKLLEAVENLYKKVVPTQVREYLESTKSNKNCNALNKEKEKESK